MRSFSFFTIFLLCLAIIVVDTLSFFWLESITTPVVSPTIKTIIDVLFWTFTIGLVSAILLLKTRMEAIPLSKRQRLISSLYGLTVSSFIPKILFVVIISILYYTNHIFTETESLIVVPVVGLLAGFLPFFVIVYAVSKAVYKFKIYRVEVHHKALPENFENLKIVHISDLHLGSFG
ncbi:MAG TPA: hypothetical protein VK021_01380, partial [Flavobacteriaceae bacterium]|nr:hypothetical protein [Flavobacteriaceae bacterium]